MTKTDKTETKRRFSYIKALEKKSQRPSNNLFEQTIIEISKKINDPSPPSCQTLTRWYKRFKSSRNSVSALVPNHKSKGNYNSKFAGKVPKQVREIDIIKSKEVDRIVAQAFDEMYLRRKMSAKALLNIINKKIEEINKNRNETNKLPTPHINSLYKRIHKLGKTRINLVRFYHYLKNNTFKKSKQNQHILLTNEKKAPSLVSKISDNYSLKTKRDSNKISIRSKKFKKIIQFLKAKQKQESKIYLCKHKAIIKEQKQGIEQRTIFDLAQVFKQLKGVIIH